MVMSIRSEELKQVVKKVSALLSTHNGGQPYASLVAFAFSNNLASFFLLHRAPPVAKQPEER